MKSQIYRKLLITVFLTSCFIQNVLSSDHPHVILIVADDLGWNDVGFHGSSEIPTPNIDALAYSGLILNNYYVAPICTPSRSALMTGKYPIHTGMQHGVLYGAEPRGLPLTERLLPEYLKDLGYVNHIVGKWHLGSYKKEYTPTYRGFDSHLGIWTGHHDYFDHTAVENPGWGLDMRRNMDVAYDLHGQYSTDIFTQESVRIIQDHNKTQPLFLYLAHVATHSGNPYEPLRAPDRNIEEHEYIVNYSRRRFAAMLSKLDESVGEVVSALSNADMLSNSIIIFTSDNGGPAAGFNLNAASNYPLKGVKNTLWEGGIKGAAFLWSPLLKVPERVSDQLMHITDWLPTVLGAIGDDAASLETIDGINLWPELSENLTSKRDMILHNIDDIFGNAALMINEWKIVKGTTYHGQWDNWYGPSGRNYTYNIGLVEQSKSAKALKLLNRFVTPTSILQLREAATLDCGSVLTDAKKCEPVQKPCLFNIRDDPCERNNLANDNPTIMATLKLALWRYNNTAVPPGNLPLDERGNPKYWNYVWTNFGDYLNDKSLLVL